VQLSLVRSSSDPSPLPQPSLHRSPSSFRELEVVRLASLRSLRTLQLDCIDLGREGLHILCHSLPHLRSLTLRRMALPTLHPLACLTRLRFLRLEQCAGVWGPALERTLRAMVHLRHIAVLRCPGVEEEALKALADEVSLQQRTQASNQSNGDGTHAASQSVTHHPAVAAAVAAAAAQAMCGAHGTNAAANCTGSVPTAYSCYPPLLMQQQSQQPRQTNGMSMAAATSVTSVALARRRHWPDLTRVDFEAEPHSEPTANGKEDGRTVNRQATV
jgi:hypothetical protein